MPGHICIQGRCAPASFAAVARCTATAAAAAVAVAAAAPRWCIAGCCRPKPAAGTAVGVSWFFHLPPCVHGRVAMCLCHRWLAVATVLPCKTGCMARQYGLFGIALWAVSAVRRASAMLPAGVCRRFLPRLWPSASAAMALPVAGGEVLAYIWLWWTNCLLWDEKLLPDGSFAVKIMWQGMLLRTKSQFLHCAVGIIMYLCPR